MRNILDKKFEATNSSIYNIYAPCFYQNLSLTNGQQKLSQSAGTVKLAGGLSCEDEMGMLGWLN